MANKLNKAKAGTVGRPRKNPASIKTRYLGFRMPEEEIKTIEAAAAAAGESVSEYVRKAIASRMGERKPLLPLISLSYEISPVRIDDNKLPSLEGKSINVPPTEMKSFGGRFHLTVDEPSPDTTLPK